MINTGSFCPTGSVHFGPLLKLVMLAYHRPRNARLAVFRIGLESTTVGRKAVPCCSNVLKIILDQIFYGALYWYRISYPEVVWELEKADWGYQDVQYWREHALCDHSAIVVIVEVGMKMKSCRWSRAYSIVNFSIANELKSFSVKKWLQVSLLAKFLHDVKAIQVR